MHLAISLDGVLINDNQQPITFRAIASVPNFELWLLLHFEDIQHPMHRDEVLKRLQRHIPSYDKANLDFFSITQDKLAIAHQRARLLSERHTAFDGTQPFTDISQLVILLTELKTLCLIILIFSYQLESVIIP